MTRYSTLLLREATEADAEWLALRMREADIQAILAAGSDPLKL